MLKVIRQFFKCSISEAPEKVGEEVGRHDEFVWALADALMWRDEEVSAAAIPFPIKEQPGAARYYDDALYLVKHVADRWDEE